MTALTAQLGTKSLLSLGVGFSDIAALVQHGRTFGNWLRTRQNDVELFESIDEDFGIVLSRRGLLDAAYMDNLWSHQLHFMIHGQIKHDDVQSRKDDDGHLERFSWLMIALITVVDICLLSSEIRDLITNVFVGALQRDDTDTLRESLNIQLQNNVEAWRSAGHIRGMVEPASVTLKDFRYTLTEESAVPQLNCAEKQELIGFLIWLMSGKTNYYRIISATVCSVAEALKCLGIKLTVGRFEQGIEGHVIVGYAGQERGEKEIFSILEVDYSSLSSTGSVPSQQVSYPIGKPCQMIESFPQSVATKNKMRKFWFRGSEAAQEVKLKAHVDEGRGGSRGIVYRLDTFDECTTAWSGDRTAFVDRHFPANSETLLTAIDDLLRTHSPSLQEWLYKEVSFTSEVPDLSKVFTEEQMGLFLSYQSLVFGYYFKLLEPLVSTDYVQNDGFFYCLWGYRDTFLLSMLQCLGNCLRMSAYSSGVLRGHIIRVLGMMYAGKPLEEDAPPGTKFSDLGIMAVISKVSVISITLLKVPESSADVAKLAIVTLPVLDLLPESDGKLWSGFGTGIPFVPCAAAACELALKKPLGTWSVHAKMELKDGRLHGVVMAARCNGIFIGTFSPFNADRLIIAEMKLKETLEPVVEHQLEASTQGFESQESHFLSGAICRPYKPRQIVLVQSQGNPAMRYAAAGFYANERIVIVVGDTLRAALRAAQKENQKWAGTGSAVIIG